MTTKHTPGPWDLDDPNLCVYGTTLDGNLVRLVDLTPADDDEIEDDELEANARLVSASPDLFAALDGVLASLKMVGPAGATACLIPDGVMVNARAAMAKARGEV